MRLRDLITLERERLVSKGMAPVRIKMSRIMHDKLLMQMRMRGEISTLMSMEVEIVDMVEDKFEIICDE